MGNSKIRRRQEQGIQMFSKLILWLFVILFGLGVLGISHAKEKIIWPYICYYPLYICENNRGVTSDGWDIMNLIGSGMGLAVVHGIVKNHGGVISVFSKLQEGTTVKVLFPIVDHD